MTQLLIVDDEAHVVERISDTVDWNAIGVEQIYKAHSGFEAIKLLSQFSIDIVITDVQMPGMNGLQLISEIRKSWSKTKCILLSGHSDFEFAKEALRHQTEDYLLKPVKNEDLVAAVQLVQAKLAQEWEKVISERRLKETFRDHLPHLKANMLLELLQGRKWEPAVLHERMNALEISGRRWELCSLMVIRLDELFVQAQHQDLSWKEYAIGNMAEELFGPRYELWYAKDAHDYLVFALSAKQQMEAEVEQEWCERTASMLQSAVGTYLKGKISVMVSRQGAFPQDIPSMYNRSVAAFRKRIGNEQQLFMRLEEDTAEAGIQSPNLLYEPPALIHLLEAARWSDVEQRLICIFEDMEKAENRQQEQLLEVYFTIASAYSYIAHKNGRQLSELLGDEFLKMATGLPFRSLNQLREWSLRTLRQIRDDANQETRHSRATLVNSIQSFIENNITQDVSLQAIANHVFLHPVYVSKVYKLETGENLSDYVQKARMNKAEYLLKHSDEKIYEIAATLRYQRPHSFHHAFKKYFGMTPQEYRDRNL